MESFAVLFFVIIAIVGFGKILAFCKEVNRKEAKKNADALAEKHAEFLANVERSCRQAVRAG